MHKTNFPNIDTRPTFLITVFWLYLSHVGSWLHQHIVYNDHQYVMLYCINNIQSPHTFKSMSWYVENIFSVSGVKLLLSSPKSWAYTDFLWEQYLNLHCVNDLIVMHVFPWIYWWLSARLQYRQSLSIGDLAISPQTTSIARYVVM